MTGFGYLHTILHRFPANARAYMGYQEMLKTSQEQITKLIAIIEKQNG